VLEYLADAVELPHRLLGLWWLLSEANQVRINGCILRCCVVSVRTATLDLPARHAHVLDLSGRGVFFEVLLWRVEVAGEG
jgi:hypothetical protein